MSHSFAADKLNYGAAPKAEVTTSVAVSESSNVSGTVRIAPAVLIQLIEMTVQDIPGVVSISSHKHKHHPSDESAGKAFDDGRARVVVDGDQIDCDIAIVVTSGANVAKLTDRIREKVGLAAGRMLGMTVRNVNIYVDDIVDSSSQARHS